MVDIMPNNTFNQCNHWLKAALSITVVRFLCSLPVLSVAFSIHAQQATLGETLREAIPQPGDRFYYAPYVKWRSHESIPVFVVRDPEDEGCSTIRSANIAQHIQLIRREIPQLDGVQDPTLVTAVPDVSTPAIIVTSPTSDEQVPEQIRKLPKGPTGSLTAYEKNQSFHLMDGVKTTNRLGQTVTVSDFNIATIIQVEAGTLRFGAAWNVNKVGELLGGPTCSEGDLSSPLYDILGALNLNTALLIAANPENLPFTPENLAWLQRLFLKTLYSAPEGAPGAASLRTTFSTTLADALRERLRK